MNNICVMYDKKEKGKQKRSVYGRIFRNKNLVLRGFDLDLKDKQIEALVGESN